MAEFGKEKPSASSAATTNLPKTMKAWRVVEFGKPLELQEVPVPEPGCCEVLLQIIVSSICHTDLDIRTGDLTALKPTSLPYTVGDEGVGKVVALGPGVKRFKIGDRVCCSYLSEACLCCENCCSGWETACQKIKPGNFQRKGHLAQFHVAKEDFLCHVPEEISDEAAAPMNGAGVTTYKALKVSGLRCGQWIVIVGAAGGLGYYAVQFAKAMGLTVIAVDCGDEKANFLKQFKDIYILDADKVDVIEKVNELTKNKGAHGALIIAPSNEALQAAPQLLRNRGTLVVVGQPVGMAQFDMANMISKSITMVGSMVGTRTDLNETLELVAEGVVRSEPTVRDFKDVNKLLDDLSNAKVTGRIVVRIPEPEHQ